MAEHQIDPETVKRCIEALRTAPGVYQSRLLASDNYIDTITIDNAVVALEALLPEPEKTDAEKLVDEWLQRNGETSEVFINGYYSEHVSLVQFVLDRVSEKVEAAINPAEALQATAEAMGFDTYSQQDTFDKVAAYFDSHALNDTYNPEPSYVYGPWMSAVDGRTPPFPIGWFYQMRNATTGELGATVEAVGYRYESANTEYRVRFEVGKWYDWTGGPCPVAGDTPVMVRFYDGHETGAYRAKSWSAGSEDWWKHEGRQGDQIIAFKVVAE